MAGIYEGEPILESRLAVKGAGAGLAATIPPGMRAVAVRVNDVVGVAGFVVPGQRVDVLVLGTPPGGSANTGTGTITKTILQNIQVLSAGQNMQKDTEGKPATVQVVNLLVTPQQAETLSLVSNDMRIQLVLRNPLDNKEVASSGTAASSVFTGTAYKPVSSELRRGREPCERRRQSPWWFPPPRSGSSYPSWWRSLTAGRRPKPSSRVKRARQQVGGGKVTGIKYSTGVTALVLAFFLTFAAAAQEPSAAAARDLFVTAGKSLVVDSPVVIQRVSVANPELAEAIAVTPREVLVNGRAAGETSLIIWQQGGNRLIFDLNVRSSSSAMDAVRREIAKELPGQDVSISVEKGAVFLRGTVKNLNSAERAAAMAATLGKTVNLLRVEVPPVDAQVLLKVRFANVDRAASLRAGSEPVLDRRRRQHRFHHDRPVQPSQAHHGDQRRGRR